MKQIFPHCLLALAIWMLPVLSGDAHETGDPFHTHDDGGELPLTMQSIKPRVETGSKKIELVAVWYDTELIVYADHYASNEPLNNASITLRGAGHASQGRHVGDGVYSIVANGLSKPGKYPLEFEVRSAALNETLKGTLEVPQPAQPGVSTPSVTVWAGGTALLLIIVGSLWRMRRRGRWIPRTALSAGCLLILIPDMMPVHAAESGSAVINPVVIRAGIQDAAPKTLADGSVFLPKPTQRLLGIRTARGAVRNHSQYVTLDALANDDFGSLIIDAVIHDPTFPEQVVAAHILATDGDKLPLTYLGSGQHSTGDTLILEFSLEDPAARLTPGMPVKVIIKTKTIILGMALPQGTVIKGDQGEQLIWLHTSAERFKPQRINAQNLDADTVVVLEGVEAGSRIVTRGAALLEQVR